MKDDSQTQSPPAARIRNRLLFHCAGYSLTILLAIPALLLGIFRDDWDRDYRISLGIAGAGLTFGCTVILGGILLRLWQEKRESRNND